MVKTPRAEHPGCWLKGFSMRKPCNPVKLIARDVHQRVLVKQEGAAAPPQRARNPTAVVVPSRTACAPQLTAASEAEVKVLAWSPTPSQAAVDAPAVAKESAFWNSQHRHHEDARRGSRWN